MPAASRAKRALNNNVGCIIIVPSWSNDLFDSFGKCIPFFCLGLGLDAFKWRHGKEKCCALIYRAPRPDAPAVPVNDALHRCEPNACAWKFRHRMKALESPEQLTCIGHIEACAVITDEINCFI